MAIEIKRSSACIPAKSASRWGIGLRELAALLRQD
jgi:hypothetical protein